MSFVRKDGGDAKRVQSAKEEDPGNPTINFRGEKRRNDTHQSPTDPESVLYRKANGKKAKLCFGGHILMENRNGLCADFTIHDPIAEQEPAVALKQMQGHQALHGGVAVTNGRRKLRQEVRGMAAHITQGRKSARKIPWQRKTHP